ncbi:hypothetical protein [Dolichospermum compactum]|nr:hypothetical protein [Dolichospermum compactum]
MMRATCLRASTKNHSKIEAEDVVYAVKQQQFSFERFIPEEHYPVLAQVYLNKDVSKDDIGQSMLVTVQGGRRAIVKNYLQNVIN